MLLSHQPKPYQAFGAGHDRFFARAVRAFLALVAGTQMMLERVPLAKADPAVPVDLLTPLIARLSELAPDRNR
ncbi:hypothetical protein [Novosphingobium rosa]|uniref:hypothetical protein n=1 Tax=Novosphingobium rosa TaxID=76978 RepID=UPI000833857F|nr:hypothetical protein [Novosphingobium rosa]